MSLETQFADAARRLQIEHPTALGIVYWFAEGGRGYVVQQYESGETLQEILERLPQGVDPHLAIAWISQVLDAVVYCHAHEPPIIHGNINPASILVTPDLTAKLNLSAALSLLVAGGTLESGYAAPEQYNGHTDERSDVFAVGAVLGRLAKFFEPHRVVEDVVRTALAPDPAQRFHSAEEMRAALAQLPRPEERGALAVHPKGLALPAQRPMTPVSLHSGSFHIIKRVARLDDSAVYLAQQAGSHAVVILRQITFARDAARDMALPPRGSPESAIPLPPPASPIDAQPVALDGSPPPIASPRDEMRRSEASPAGAAGKRWVDRVSTFMSTLLLRVRSADQVPPPILVDRVHFTVTSPEYLVPGSSVVIDVWAHLEQQRHEVVERARQAYGDRTFRQKSKGPIQVTRQTELTVRLTIDGLLVDDPQETLWWVGEIATASFPVRVPSDAIVGTKRALASVHVNGLQVARIYFDLVIAEGRQAAAQAAPLQLREDRHRRAFASYASLDKDAVLGRIQGMQKAAPGLEVFLDVLSLRSGQDWEAELSRVIPRSDVFYLFWSEHARRSAWVDKEWRCALKERGLDFIDPVPLMSPAQAPPPPELAGKHFNDWVLAFQSSHGSSPGGAQDNKPE